MFGYASCIILLFKLFKAAVTKGNSPVYLKLLAKYTTINSLNVRKESPIKMALNQDIKKFSRAIETLIQLGCELETED